MAKRILSWVLSMALLLGCVSGLTLISSAENVVKAGNLVPETYDANQGAFFKGSFDGFNVFGWQKPGWTTWNNAKIANALGVAGGTVVDTLSFSFDYYWDKGENSDNNWWQFKTVNEDGSGTPDDGFGTFLTYGMTGGAWDEITITRDKQKLGQGDDLSINIGDLNNSKLYIRGMKVVATVGENTYTALWGSYLIAKLDFSTGEIVGTNANITHNHSAENATNANKADFVVEVNDKGLVEVDGAYGMAMYQQNSGFGINFANIGISGDVALTFEYYLPEEANIQANTRCGMYINDHVYQLNAGGNASHAALKEGEWSTVTLIVSGEDAAVFADGEGLNLYCWNYNNNGYYDGDDVRADWGGDYYYLRSVSLMPASMLSSVEDPGYKFYDYEETYAPNPFYPDTTVQKAFGLGVALGDNGSMAYYNVTSDKANIGIKFIMKEDAEATELTIDYQTKSAEEVPDGWRGTNGAKAAVVDGVATYVFADAVFQNGLNGLGSFRMGLDAASQVARVEVYELQDKTDLNATIAAAKEADTTGKTEASIAKLNAAIAAAEAVAANEWATAGDVAAAKDALTAAIDGLKNIREVGYGDRLGHVEFDYYNGEYQDEGANIGFTDQGEWFEYEVNVKEDGLYNINVEMATDNADSTIEVQDGNGKVYGSFVVPKGGWSNYNTYTVTTALAAGVQKLRIVYKQSSANYRGMSLSDGRYTLTNATWYPALTETTNAHYGMIEKKDGRYAWHIQHNKGLAIGFANGYEALKDVTSVTIEMDYWLESNENYSGNTDGDNGGINPPNRRFLLKVGGSDVVNDAGVGGTKNTFNMGSIATLGGGFDGWSTVKFEMADVDMTQTFWTGASLRVMFYDEGSDTAEEGPGCYISGFRVYATEDPSKIIAISFTETTNKVALQDEVDAAITDGSLYSTVTWEAYQAALAAAQDLLNSDNAAQDDVDAALANLKAAKAALADKRYTLNNATTDMNPNSTVLADGIITLGENQYAWVVGGTPENKVSNKWIGIGDPNGILANSTSVTYEYDIMFDSATNLNARVFLCYGTTSGWKGVNDKSNDPYFNGFVAHGGWLPTPANGEWGTISIVNNEYSATTLDNNCITRLGFWAEETSIYVKAIRAYDSEDPSKMISLTFTKVPGKDDLQAALDNALDLSGYVASSTADYTAAIEAIEALLAQETVTEQEVLAALAALEAAEAKLISANFDLPLANWNNIVDGVSVADQLTEFDGKQCITWTKTGGMSWNNGIIKNAAGLTEDAIVDLKITVSYYWQDAGENGDWWHFNTVDKDGGSAPGIANGNPHDNGFGTFTEYGMVRNQWATVTVAREDQQLSSSQDNLYINVGGLASGNAFYIRGIVYEITLEDGDVLTGTWGDPIVPALKDALQAAVDSAVTDLGFYTEASASAYTAALEAAKAVLADEEATKDEADKALADLKAAAAALEKQVFDLIVVDISTTQGDNPKIGDKVYFTFTVKNNGDVTIPEGAKYGGIVKIGDTMIGWSDHYKSVDVAPALAPGETLVLTLCGGPEENPTGAWTVTEEPVEVFAQVNDNPGDGINETITDNNTFTKTITPCNLYFEDLVQAIAEEITDLTPYTEESAAAYTAALEAAKALIGNLETTQEAIDAALEALEDAALGLVEKGDEPTPVGKAGDVDGDGEITSTDARLVLQLYAKKITEADLDVNVADVDGDKQITSTDARLILQLYAKKIDAFPTPAE